MSTSTQAELQEKYGENAKTILHKKVKIVQYKPLKHPFQELLNKKIIVK